MTLPVKQLCAWCQAEGITTVLQEGEEPASHGICARHQAAWLEELNGLEKKACARCGDPLSTATQEDRNLLASGMHPWCWERDQEEMYER